MYPYLYWPKFHENGGATGWKDIYESGICVNKCPKKDEVLKCSSSDVDN